MKGSHLNEQNTAVLLIDGQCLLCSRITRFVAKRDAGMYFQFASLQSPAGRKLLMEGHLSLDDYDTFVMVQDGRYYTKSAAALRVFRKLNRLWPLLFILILVPAAWRNRVYDWIAHHRYQRFGKTDLCIMPAPDVKARFLENGIHAVE
ncbi:DCC1-like thiol-disulfide oxidoreductase family protein [Paenibacillus alkaliterrae]|uniref:thiol-disulfide oxidoreductase DCC family protein n=1 Tax=Paenibacillus alkaliterrae TaxID=320909 RepID=UPI001F3E87C6|nr:DCC1-like thiol-disulfide oxidoreductase family protein [Paenibacillus alkaliterrae]MCF2938238.1 DCC1-like thiol-disulfide oxidoreductase family protein [Paenibacillus alkaliterrae]